MILAIDPGRDKCGVVVIGEGHVVERRIVATAELREAVREVRARRPEVRRVLIGDGTGHGKVRDMIEGDVEIVPERGTTLRARTRYFRENPPPWYLKWIPLSMRVPPVPIDDWAAVVLAEDYLAARKQVET